MDDQTSKIKVGVTPAGERLRDEAPHVFLVVAMSAVADVDATVR